MTVSRQLLDEFQQLVADVKDKEQGHYQALLAVPVALDDVRIRETVTPETLAAACKPLRDKISAAVNAILAPAAAEDLNGSLAELQALTAQGDFADRLRRSHALRYASYARRTVHAAGRRKSHATDGGYIANRVVGRITIRLKGGNLA